MLQLELSITEIVTTVFDSVLGLQAVPDDSFQLTKHLQHTYAGVVPISGAWDGAVAVQCSDQLARQALKRTFSKTGIVVGIFVISCLQAEICVLTV